jgi:hypothetical protein
MPMTDAIIRVMAKMAKTKKTVVAEPTFSINGRAVASPDVETPRVRFADEHLPGPVDPACNMDYALENMEPVEGDLPEITELGELRDATSVSRISDDSHVPAESVDDAVPLANQGVDADLPTGGPLDFVADHSIDDVEDQEPVQEAAEPNSCSQVMWSRVSLRVSSLEAGVATTSGEIDAMGTSMGHGKREKMGAAMPTLIACPSTRPSTAFPRLPMTR